LKPPAIVIAIVLAEGYLFLRARDANLYSVQSSLLQQRAGMGATVTARCLCQPFFLSLLPVPLQFSPARDSMPVRSGRRPPGTNEEIDQERCTLLNASMMLSPSRLIQKGWVGGGEFAPGLPAGIAVRPYPNGANNKANKGGELDYFHDRREWCGRECDHVKSLRKAKKPFDGSGRP
jgi:hypothetical protein